MTNSWLAAHPVSKINRRCLVNRRKPLEINCDYRQMLQPKPLVYGLAVNGVVFYIGMTADLKVRYSTYARGLAKDKTHQHYVIQYIKKYINSHVNLVVLHETTDIRTARIKELEMIKDINPVANIAGNKSFERII